MIQNIKLHGRAKARLAQYLEEEVFVHRSGIEIEFVEWNTHAKLYRVWYSSEDLEGRNYSVRDTYCVWRVAGEDGAVLEDFISEHDEVREEQFKKAAEWNKKNGVEPQGVIN